MHLANSRDGDEQPAAACAGSSVSKAPRKPSGGRDWVGRGGAPGQASAAPPTGRNVDLPAPAGASTNSEVSSRRPGADDQGRPLIPLLAPSSPQLGPFLGIWRNGQPYGWVSAGT